MILVAIGVGTTVVNLVGNKIIAEQAKNQIADQQEHHDNEYQKHRQIANSTTAELKGLGDKQQAALDDVLPRIKAFVERNERQLRIRAREIVDGGEASTNREIDASPVVSGLGAALSASAGVGSAFAGIGLSGAAYAAVAKFATASTGAAINTLNGAAARSATLAAIGGGAKAAGGGGIAAGVLRLNVITAIPAAALTVGMMIKSKSDADKAVTKSDGDVKKAIATYKHRNTLLRGVDRRVDELRDVLAGLVSQAGEALRHLEATEREPGGFDLDNDDHAHRLQTALLVTKGVGDIAAATVVNPDLTLDSKGEYLVVKYRNYKPEQENG
ncbi:hypothetical protein ACIBAC_19090 [Streptomyces sp. NPDC051362]|uniref:hypothetical protein n=1 Tax=Streptomyces sp. NPDC051362 TaxID=3365651 RepID=UPI0037AD413F